MLHCDTSYQQFWGQTHTYVKTHLQIYIQKQFQETRHAPGFKTGHIFLALVGIKTGKQVDKTWMVLKN